MLPTALESSYRLHKSDTSAFVKWLTETAAKCGYISKSTKAEVKQNDPPSSQRLKGKARKQAKAAAAKQNVLAQKQPPPSISVLKRTMAVKELVPQAKAVATHVEAPVIVPAEIVRLGFRALSARKKCAAWFHNQMKADPIALKSNDQHSYLIDLFEELLSILKPLFEIVPPPEPTPNEILAPAGNPSNTQDLKPLENLFMSLEVEEVEGEGDTSEQVETGRSTSKLPSDRVSYELESPKGKHIGEDVVFAIFCLFNNYHSTRQYILEVGSEYKAGKLDLISASVTTNTAFELARREEEDFIASSPRCQDFHKTLDVLSQYFSIMSHLIDGPEVVVKILGNLADIFNLHVFSI
ncbi:MAG: hypothetical protein MMC33_002920 [Icmadophila ericetorum]|nr:hypothetical protein [Icmadophila ericetorum]